MRSDLYRNISAENSVDDAEEEIPIPQDEFLKNRRIRVLTFTSLFPNRIQPRHGIFVETRLRNLISDFNVDARIISPVPWFPFRSRIFGRYHKYALTDLQDIRAGELPVSYPRYLVIPRVGINFQPDSMARSARGLIRQFLTSGWRPDVIDAHYFYPDGVAAAILANEFDIPLMITARGTDVNVIGRIPGPAKRILWASKVASSVVAVSDRLRDNLVAIGVDESKIVVLRNGVDLNIFRPEPQPSARDRMGLVDGKIAVCVGNLVPEKGFALAIESLNFLPEFRLLIIGDGPERENLHALCRVHGLEHRVVFAPVMPQTELCYAYSCADVLLLTSTREGWPNVLLEALACGTPVVTVDVGAVGQILRGTDAGRIVKSRDARLIAAAVDELIRTPCVRAVAHRHAGQFDWASISRGQMEIFSRLLN